MNRHTITLEDGRVYEACSNEEWLSAPSDDCFETPTGFYRIKPKEPRTFEGRVGTYPGQPNRVYVDWPGGTAVIVTEKVQG